MEKPTPTMKSLRRLIRRASAHGIKVGPVKYDITQARAVFGSRHVKIRDDGSYVQDILPRAIDEDRVRSDPHAVTALFHRFHAGEMNWAAECRRRRWTQPAMLSVRAARRERVWRGHHG